MKGFKYVAIDGHGRANFFEKAYAEGCKVGGKPCKAGDERFRMVNVVLLKADIPDYANSKICVSLIAQNQDSHKTVTELGEDYLYLSNNLKVLLVMLSS